MKVQYWYLSAVPKYSIWANYISALTRWNLTRLEKTCLQVSSAVSVYITLSPKADLSGLPANE